jgi:hypothetical protein
MPAVVMNNTLASYLNPLQPTYKETNDIPTCQGGCIERSGGVMVLLLYNPSLYSKKLKINMMLIF